MATGLPPAPRWAWIVMITGVVAVSVMLPIAIGRGHADLATSASERTPASRTTEPTTSSSPEPTTSSSAESSTAAPTPDVPPVIAVYGDSYSAGTDQGGSGPAGWPAILAGSLEAEVRLHAVQATGYVAGGGGTFLQQVQASPEPDADVVVVFGSRNDTDVPTDQVSTQATATIQAVQAASPSADVVIIGPAWSDAAVPAGTLPARDAVRGAAEAAGVTFVDPLTDGWFFGRLELIGADAINPTDEGHAYLAGLIEPIVREALTRADAE